MEYTMTLIVTISCLLTMALCYQDKKAEIQGNEKGRIPIIYIYINLVLFGALGALLCFLFINYQKGNRKFLLFIVVNLILEGIIIYLMLK